MFCLRLSTTRYPGCDVCCQMHEMHTNQLVKIFCPRTKTSAPKLEVQMSLSHTYISSLRSHENCFTRNLWNVTRIPFLRRARSVYLSIERYVKIWNNQYILTTLTHCCLVTNLNVQIILGRARYVALVRIGLASKQTKVWFGSRSVQTSDSVVAHLQSCRVWFLHVPIVFHLLIIWLKIRYNLYTT